jgi:hypothetical protein
MIRATFTFLLFFLGLGDEASDSVSLPEVAWTTIGKHKRKEQIRAISSTIMMEIMRTRAVAGHGTRQVFSQLQAR